MHGIAYWWFPIVMAPFGSAAVAGAVFFISPRAVPYAFVAAFVFYIWLAS